MITSAPLISAYPGPYPPMTRAAREERDCTTKGVERERHKDGKSRSNTGGKHIFAQAFFHTKKQYAPHSTLCSSTVRSARPVASIPFASTHCIRLHCTATKCVSTPWRRFVAKKRSVAQCRHFPIHGRSGIFTRVQEKNKPCLCQTSPPMYRVFPQPPPPRHQLQIFPSSLLALSFLSSPSPSPSFSCELEPEGRSRREEGGLIATSSSSSSSFSQQRRRRAVWWWWWRLLAGEGFVNGQYFFPSTGGARKTQTDLASIRDKTTTKVVESNSPPREEKIPRSKFFRL